MLTKITIDTHRPEISIGYGKQKGNEVLLRDGVLSLFYPEIKPKSNSVVTPNKESYLRNLVQEGDKNILNHSIIYLSKN